MIKITYDKENAILYPEFGIGMLDMIFFRPLYSASPSLKLQLTNQILPYLVNPSAIFHREQFGNQRSHWKESFGAIESHRRIQV